MKTKLYNLLLIAFALFCITACKDDKEDVYPTFPRPNWEVNTSENFSATMTAVVILPDELLEFAEKDDLIAVFINEECRGKGTLVEKEGEPYYYFTIKGYYDEQGKMTFQYYNTARSYLYRTGAILDFEPDGIWGVIDLPKVLDLSIVME